MYKFLKIILFVLLAIYWVSPDLLIGPIDDALLTIIYCIYVNKCNTNQSVL